MYAWLFNPDTCVHRPPRESRLVIIAASKRGMPDVGLEPTATRLKA